MLSYRVYDTKKKCWVKDNVYLAPDGELFMIKRMLFGLIKRLPILSPDRYIYHRNINLQDKNSLEIYEGDYIKAQVKEEESVIGFVVYAHELSSYVILCVDSNEFFTLGSEVCELIEVIGNVFDGYEVVQDGEQTLSDSEE